VNKERSKKMNSLRISRTCGNINSFAEEYSQSIFCDKEYDHQLFGFNALNSMVLYGINFLG